MLSCFIKELTKITKIFNLLHWILRFTNNNIVREPAVFVRCIVSRTELKNAKRILLIRSSRKRLMRLLNDVYAIFHPL